MLLDVAMRKAIMVTTHISDNVLYCITGIFGKFHELVNLSIGKNLNW